MYPFFCGYIFDTSVAYFYSLWNLIFRLAGEFTLVC